MSDPNWCGDFDDSKALRQRLGRPDGFRSCALVGASGLLARERLGEEIDSHDLVIRMNLGPVRGYTAVVGGKTTLRIMNTAAVRKVLAGHSGAISRGDTSWCPRYPVYMNCANLSVVDLLPEACAGATPLFLSNSSLFPAGGEHLKLLKRLQPQGFNAMTGTWALVMATMLCPNGVDLYGYTHRASLPVIRDLALPYHYYDAVEVNTTVDSLGESARLLSDLGEEQPGCVRLKVPGRIHGLHNATRAWSEGGPTDAAVDTVVFNATGGPGHSGTAAGGAAAGGAGGPAPPGQAPAGTAADAAALGASAPGHLGTAVDDAAAGSASGLGHSGTPASRPWATSVGLHVGRDAPLAGLPGAALDSVHGTMGALLVGAFLSVGLLLWGAVACARRGRQPHTYRPPFEPEEETLEEGAETGP